MFSFLSQEAIDLELDHREDFINTWSLCMAVVVKEVKALIRLLTLWFSRSIFNSLNMVMRLNLRLHEIFNHIIDDCHFISEILILFVLLVQGFYDFDHKYEESNQIG